MFPVEIVAGIPSVLFVLMIIFMILSDDPVDEPTVKKGRKTK